MNFEFISPIKSAIKTSNLTLLKSLINASNINTTFYVCYDMKRKKDEDMAVFFKLSNLDICKFEFI